MKSSGATRKPTRARRWFDAEDKLPLFPFGFGLSYKTFAYSAMHATPSAVTFADKNTGRRAGAEIAQVYAALPKEISEPPKRLVAWEEIELGAGESKTVTLAVDPKYLSVFDAGTDSWRLTPGKYTFYAGGSSRALPLAEPVEIGAAK